MRDLIFFLKRVKLYFKKYALRLIIVIFAIGFVVQMLYVYIYIIYNICICTGPLYILCYMVSFCIFLRLYYNFLNNTFMYVII